MNQKFCSFTENTLLPCCEIRWILLPWYQITHTTIYIFGHTTQLSSGEMTCENTAERAAASAGRPAHWRQVVWPYTTPERKKPGLYEHFFCPDMGHRSHRRNRAENRGRETQCTAELVFLAFLVVFFLSFSSYDPCDVCRTIQEEAGITQVRWRCRKPKQYPCGNEFKMCVWFSEKACAFIFLWMEANAEFMKSMQAEK